MHQKFSGTMEVYGDRVADIDPRTGGPHGLPFHKKAQDDSSTGL